MKGLLLAGLSFLVLMGLSLVLLRFYRGKKYYRVFLLAFAMMLLFYGAIYRLCPDDLAFLPPLLVEPNQQVDFWLGAFVLFLLFHIFWDVAYAAVLTGFSSHLIVLLSRSGGMSLSELLKIYHASEPVDGVLAWRIEGLIRGKYLVSEGAGFRLTRRGAFLASSSRWLRQLYAIEKKVG